MVESSCMESSCMDMESSCMDMESSCMENNCGLLLKVGTTQVKIVHQPTN